MQRSGVLCGTLATFWPRIVSARRKAGTPLSSRRRSRQVVTRPENALIVQSDSSVLLDVHAPRAAEARAALAPFAELVKSPEHIHTYRLTPLSIWNACASGLAAGQMVAALNEHARYPVPANVEPEILELAARYGRGVITRDGYWLICTCSDDVTAERLSRDREAGRYLAVRIDATKFRGHIVGTC